MIGAVGGLSLRALPGPGYAKSDWYRAVSTAHAREPLAWRHTYTSTGRFKQAKAIFPLLYLAPDEFTALLEVRSLLGHPRSGSTVRGPGSWHVVQVNVRLDRVVDLRTTSERTRIETTVQELTGDWEDYAVRTNASPDVSSNPPAPTQKLGESLYQLTNCQGFLTPSARNSILPNLVVFPDRVGIDPHAVTIRPQ